MQIELNVKKHPSGRHTLTERTQLDMTPKDCAGDLFGNMNAGSFYRAVATKLHTLYQAGHEVTYKDAASEPAPQRTGHQRIENERQRQIDREGYSTSHDDEHSTGELVAAAACYGNCHDASSPMPHRWPWESAAWKPKDRLRNLERAGALYLAAAERARRNGEDDLIHRSAVDSVAHEIDLLTA
jgi:hypothetical protein